jgi:hypothetical protein
MRKPLHRHGRLQRTPATDRGAAISRVAALKGCLGCAVSAP